MDLSTSSRLQNIFLRPFYRVILVLLKELKFKQASNRNLNQAFYQLNIWKKNLNPILLETVVNVFLKMLNKVNNMHINT